MEPLPGLDPAAQTVRSASFLLPEDRGFKDAALEATKVRKGEQHVVV